MGTPMTLAAGTETDQMVADAIGLKYRIDCGFCEFSDPTIGPRDPLVLNYWRLFRPSTDLNAAFLAASMLRRKTWPEYRLFKQHCLGLVSPSGNEPMWSMMCFYDGGCDDLSPQPTPALAICAAILLEQEPKAETA